MKSFKIITNTEGEYGVELYLNGEYVDGDGFTSDSKACIRVGLDYLADNSY